MKNKLFVTCAFFILILASTQFSCKRDCISGQGSVLTKDITPNDLNFNKIEISKGDFDVEIIQDNVFKVELKSQPNLSSYFEAYQSNNILVLNQTTSKCIESDEPIKFYVHLPFANNLNEISNYGTGYIRCMSLETNYLYIKNTASGDIDIYNLYSNDLVEADLRGTGDISLSGKDVISRSTYTNSGYGTIDAKNLICKESRTSALSSGSIYVYVLNRLDANISGSGSIYYRGGPFINASGQGSGNIIQLRGK